jgi:c-di-GMP-binding flagellar brake protein YcgR
MRIFDQAVREQALVVLTLQDDHGWQTFKSRFLERDANHRFFVLDFQAHEDETLPDISPGQYIGVSFRYKSRKIMFSTVIEAKGRYVLDDQTSIAAIRYRWPQSMTELQRRAYFRTPVPPGTTVAASLWEGGTEARVAAQQGALQLVSGSIVDMSCGGCLVQLSEGNAPSWRENTTLGIELQLPDGKPPIVVNGNFRGARLGEDGTLRIAVQYVGLELSVDGRVILQRLAATIQRLHRLNANLDGRTERSSGWNL